MGGTAARNAVRNFLEFPKVPSAAAYRYGVRNVNLIMM